MGIKFNIMPKKFTVDIDGLKPTDIILDVRSLGEFKRGSITEHNIPILKESDRGFFYRYTPLVLWIILNGLNTNKKSIQQYVDSILAKYHNKDLRIVLACSGGRLRSPITWVYLKRKYPNITFRVLKGGITKALELKGDL